MEKFSKTLSLYLYNHDLIYKNQIAWCQYILINRIMGLLSFIILVPLGSIVFNFSTSFVFFCFFRFLRSRTGGFHAKTPCGCIVASSVNHITFLLLAHASSKISILWILCIPTSIIIFSLSPANNANLHLSSTEFLLLKSKIFFRIIIAVLSATVMYYIDVQISICIAMVMVSVASLLALAHLGYGQQ